MLGFIGFLHGISIQNCFCRFFSLHPLAFPLPSSTPYFLSTALSQVYCPSPSFSSTPPFLLSGFLQFHSLCSQLIRTHIHCDLGYAFEREHSDNILKWGFVSSEFINSFLWIYLGCGSKFVLINLIYFYLGK